MPTLSGFQKNPLNYKITIWEIMPKGFPKTSVFLYGNQTFARQLSESGFFGLVDDRIKSLLGMFRKSIPKH
jgi:hypothetical protein